MVLGRQQSVPKFSNLVLLKVCALEHRSPRTILRIAPQRDFMFKLVLRMPD